MPVTFISGSGSAPGSTIIGSSPGCQRSMLSAEPNDELPKNRLEVLNEKLSRIGAGSTAATAPDGPFELVERLGFGRLRDIVMRERRGAQGRRQFRIELGGLAGGNRVDGLGAHHGGIRIRRIFPGGLGLRGRGLCGRVFGGGSDEAVALQGAVDLGEIFSLVAKRRLHDRIARHRAGDVDVPACRDWPADRPTLGGDEVPIGRLKL